MGPRRIPLSSGQFALVDPIDFRRVMKFKWSYSKSAQDEQGYACTWAGGKKIYLHRFITDAPKGMEVDHEDGDRLNNCRGNLRVATRKQNAANASRWRRPKHSRFKGVSRDRGGRWFAQIMKDGKNNHLGVFDSEEQAARAYDAAARELFGDFARTNFGD